MKDKTKLKKKGSDRRQRRIRKKIRGNSLKPRLSVYKSLNHTYAQLVDDEEGIIITGVSSLTPEVKKVVKKEDRKTEVSKKVGIHVAKLAQEKGISITKALQQVSRENPQWAQKVFPGSPIQ